MADVTHPSREAVRQYMQERATAKTPPPAPAEIRRQLGWGLLSQQQPGRR